MRKVVELLIKQRLAGRARQEWAESDVFAMKLTAMGSCLEDGKAVRLATAGLTMATFDMHRQGGIGTVAGSGKKALVLHCRLLFDAGATLFG